LLQHADAPRLDAWNVRSKAYRRRTERLRDPPPKAKGRRKGSSLRPFCLPLRGRSYRYRRSNALCSICLTHPAGTASSASVGPDRARASHHSPWQRHRLRPCDSRRQSQWPARLPGCQCPRCPIYGAKKSGLPDDTAPGGGIRDAMAPRRIIESTISLRAAPMMFTSFKFRPLAGRTVIEVGHVTSISASLCGVQALRQWRPSRFLGSCPHSSPPPK
jgi:hypothetical protein